MGAAGADDGRAAALRAAMVRDQLVARGIRDERVLAAFRKVRREMFIPDVAPDLAYEDHPIAIGCSQTISQPYIVARTLECLALKPKDRALEIGTGSGYQTALLAELCREVDSVERIAELAEAARARLLEMGYANVEVRLADGTLGWPEKAPYDAIVVSAAAPRIPQPLLDQLADGGRMVIPVGDLRGQDLVLAERKGRAIKTRSICGCVFVRLIGKEGWKANQEV
ncbi:MAG: protein-L-isoaspartate(D-aspartate) O-methyltransferase [Candidatus Brocadiia bacterium]